MKDSMSRDSRGNYQRDLGYEGTDDDGFKQHRFYLGRDRVHALIRVVKLEQCWACVVKRWQRDHATPRPVWDEDTLPLAQVLARGEEVARLETPAHLSVDGADPAIAVAWLDRLQGDFPVIRLELADGHKQQQGEQFWQAQAANLRGEVPDQHAAALLPLYSSQTLHAALDAFAQHLRQHYRDASGQTSEHGNNAAKQVVALKGHVNNMPLVAFDLIQIENLIRHFRHRPLTKRGNPASVEWVKNMIKRVRAFIKWLHRAPDWQWRRPADYEVEPVRIPSGPPGHAATAPAPVYTLDELCVLWEYATPKERLLTVLALNAGFGAAEIRTLQKREVFLNPTHPQLHLKGDFIKKARSGNRVYGEWQLWDVTAAALRWYQKRRPRTKEPALLVTNSGKALAGQSPSGNHLAATNSAWEALTRRIHKDHPDFRRLSFNKLRKTAGELVNTFSDAQTAAVFLCCGKPGPPEAMAAADAARHFDEVFRALTAMRAYLAPMFERVPDAFPAAAPKGNLHHSLGKVKQVVELRRQGHKLNEIVELTGLPLGTVRYHLQRAKNTATARRYDAAIKEQVRRLRGEGKKLKDIAAATGVPVGTVWNFCKQDNTDT